MDVRSQIQTVDISFTGQPKNLTCAETMFTEDNRFTDPQYCFNTASLQVQLLEGTAVEASEVLRLRLFRWLVFGLVDLFLLSRGLSQSLRVS